MWWPRWWPGRRQSSRWSLSRWVAHAIPMQWFLPHLGANRWLNWCGGCEAPDYEHPAHHENRKDLLPPRWPRQNRQTELLLLHRAGGTADDSLPEGFEIYENVGGQVFLRHKQPKLITDDELAMVKEALKRHAEELRYRVEVKKTAVASTKPLSTRRTAHFRMCWCRAPTAICMARLSVAESLSLATMPPAILAVARCSRSPPTGR